MAMNPTQPTPHTRIPCLVVGAALLLLVLPAGGSAAPRSRAFLSAHRDLVKALRVYLDPARDHHRGWTAVEDVLEPMTLAGDPVLADPDRLRWLTEQARTFAPPFTDRGWRNLAGVSALERHGRMRRLVSEQIRLAWSEPRGYDAKGSWRAYPRPAPRPWLITLHEERDLRARDPAGISVLKRRWPYGQAKDLHESWLMLAPEAPAAEFVRPDGSLHIQRVVAPLQEFWQRYHVDFERVILEGRTAAVDLAAAFPYWLAGLVLRGGTLDARQRTLVPNFAWLPVFVVADEALAAQLRGAGHKAVATGTSAEALAWMKSQRRQLPTSYRWDATHPLHARSPWVQVEARDPGVAKTTLQVTRVDTPTDPNTIRITSVGVRTLSVLLDDRIVNLDRPVRIVINDRLCYTARVSHARFGRDFKQLWAGKPFRLRHTRRYMDLVPSQAAHIDVPAPR